MKKILLLALATVLTLSMMTGCRNKNNKAESAMNDVATTISEGLDDITGNNNTDKKTENTTERRTEITEESESTQGETNARSRRGINRR